MRGLLALYLGALAVALTTLGLSTSSLYRARWVSSSTPTVVPVVLTTSYGLFQKCETSSYLPGVVECRPFPQRGRDCGRREAELPKEGGAQVLSGEDHDEEDERWGFCESWYTAGYAHQLSLVFALANLIALVLTLVGTATVGRGFRTEKLRSGWKLVAGLMTLQALCLVVSSSLIAYERNHDRRFAHGAHLGRSWTMTTVSYALNLAVVLALLFVRATGRLRIVPGEDGYEPISA
ncbi:hypothetical protein JCM10213_008516 [Rhodosporidiobolus nylandii]